MDDHRGLFRLFDYSIDHQGTHGLLDVVTGQRFFTLLKYLLVRSCDRANPPILDRLFSNFMIIGRLKSLLGCSILRRFIVEDLLLGLKISYIIDLILKEKIRIFISQVAPSR